MPNKALHRTPQKAPVTFNVMQHEAEVRELHDLVASLLDRDGGSCRDLNFEAPTWTGVERLLTKLEIVTGQISGTDHEGNILSTPFRESAVVAAKICGYAHLLLSPELGLIKTFQVFISCEEDGSPFVEVTFFPEDVEPAPSLREDFIAWANQLQLWLEARRYYARYENASWKFGDTEANSGVFLVSNKTAERA